MGEYHRCITYDSVESVQCWFQRLIMMSLIMLISQFHSLKTLNVIYLIVSLLVFSVLAQSNFVRRPSATSCRIEFGSSRFVCIRMCEESILTSRFPRSGWNMQRHCP